MFSQQHLKSFSLTCIREEASVLLPLKFQISENFVCLHKSEYFDLDTFTTVVQIFSLTCIREDVDHLTTLKIEFVTYFV